MTLNQMETNPSVTPKQVSTTFYQPKHDYGQMLTDEQIKHFFASETNMTEDLVLKS